MQAKNFSIKVLYNNEMSNRLYKRIENKERYPTGLTPNQQKKKEQGLCFLVECPNSLYTSRRCLEHYKKPRYTPRPRKERDVDRPYFRAAKFHYGILKTDYFELWKKQRSRCAICAVPFHTLIKRPQIDHCHETGKIRGLLCSRCNLGLGNFSDNPKLLQRAIKYLKKTGKN